MFSSQGVFTSHPSVLDMQTLCLKQSSLFYSTSILEPPLLASPETKGVNTWKGAAASSRVPAGGGLEALAHRFAASFTSLQHGAGAGRGNDTL